MADDDSGVVDDDLKFLDYENLYCCDVSVFPSIRRPTLADPHRAGRFAWLTLATRLDCRDGRASQRSRATRKPSAPVWFDGGFQCGLPRPRRRVVRTCRHAADGDFGRPLYLLLGSAAASAPRAVARSWHHSRRCRAGRTGRGRWAQQADCERTPELVMDQA
jgi:hypothetical protein